MFECEVCGYTTKQKGELKQHKMNKHNIGIICGIVIYTNINVNNRLH